jgi:hypothetical protein
MLIEELAPSRRHRRDGNVVGHGHWPDGVRERGREAIDEERGEERDDVRTSAISGGHRSP